MKSIGNDSSGDEHLIPDADDPTLHKADSICGCNPDPFCDDPGYRGDYKTPVSYYWVHFHLGYD